MIAKTDGNGSLTYQATYEAYGKRTQESGSTQDRQKANTKDEDPTGLLNEGFRYRDLDTGTFITRDPAGFVDGPNMYAYVVCNPWTKFDPEGLFWGELWSATKNYTSNVGKGAQAVYADTVGRAMGGSGSGLNAEDYRQAGLAGAKAGLAVSIGGLTGGTGSAGMVTLAGRVAYAGAASGAASATTDVVTAAVTGEKIEAGQVLDNAAHATVIGGGTQLVGEAASAIAKAIKANAATKTAATELTPTQSATQDAVQGAENAAENNPYRGGPHSETKGPRGDGLDSHHMPDRNADPRVSAEDGPAIQMDPQDHVLTSSNGRNGRAGAIYRSETADMIANGNYRGAMAREVRDVRNAANQGSGDRTKYNGAIKEMLNHARSSGQLPPNPRTGK